jgi:hypothetical protein
LGPWLGIAAAFATGLWGNYCGDLKTALAAEPIAGVLAANSIYMVQPGGDRDSILLSFYTPHLATALTDWRDLPSESYGWGNTQLVPVTAPDYQVVATLGEWQLIRAPLLPRLTPRG